MSQFVIAALYKFVTLDDYESLKPTLLQRCQDLDIKGTLLLAQEGNGTIADLGKESIKFLTIYALILACDLTIKNHLPLILLFIV